MTPPATDLRVSIPGEVILWFYGRFSIGAIYLTVANTLTEAAKVKATGWTEIPSIATMQLVHAAGASLTAAYIIVDEGNPALSAILRERHRRKDLAGGREQGRAEANAL